MSVVLKEENSEGVRKVMKVSKVMSVKLEIEGLRTWLGTERKGMGVV